MLDQRRAARPEQTREQLFTERYDSLLAWAMRLTNRYDEAADLVQDAFVQFMLGRTALEQIENIDGYLRRMLGYMHAARMSRQAQRLQDATLSVADYDSLSLGWTAIEPPRRMQAFEELQQICSYACARKESSRAGSVLILRYFHDYFPTEIASILGSSRHCVDQWQRLARREVKLFMNEPGRLRFVDAKRAAERSVRKSFASGDPMSELRQMIFMSRQGPCFSAEELHELYAVHNSDALTTTRLAHIVSCRSCLDVVNGLLGLPSLAQRGSAEPPIEPPDNDEPPIEGSGGGSSGGGPLDVRRKLGKHLRTISEHKPHELRISVNGLLVSSLKVSSERMEVDLNLDRGEPVEFIEITSEQGVQLLFFSSGNGSDPEQWAWIELSEGRTLAAFLRLQDGPSLRVIYKDPLPADLSADQEMIGADLSSPLALVPTVDETVESKVATQTTVELLRSWIKRLVRVLKRSGAAERVTDEARARAETSDTVPRFLLLSAQLDRGRVSLRRGFVAIIVVALMAAGVLIWMNLGEPTLTAASLLERATVAEQAVAQSRDQASHRLINLEERRSPEGAVVSRRTIEIWTNHATGDRAQRLYDETNRLIAGTWQKADGSRVVFHHGSKPRPQAAPALPSDLLLSLESIWQLDPSPTGFVSLIAAPVDVTVERRSTSYVLTFDKERTIGGSRLLKATLTLSQSDLRPIEQTLLVQVGGELREYRFAEASFELVPGKAVDKAVFEVEPELIGGARPTGRTGDWAHRDLTSSRVPPLMSALTPAVASAELEVDVAYLLNHAKADRNEQVALTRSAGGSLRVEGIVETEQRKQELLRALAPVSQNPAVTIDIRTVDEALQRTPAPSAISIYEAGVTASTVAVDRELREYFSKHNSIANDDLDEAVRSFSSRTVKRAYDALFQAIALKRVVNRFANVDMRTVAPDARAKWLAMVGDRAGAFSRETAILRRELQPIFFAGAEVNAVEPLAIASDEDLGIAVERLHKLALANNGAVAGALTISSRSSAAALKSSFWRLSAEAQALAQAIERYAK